MRRSIPFVICFSLCLFATGLTLTALAQGVFRQPVLAHNRSSETAAANVVLVRRFYAAAAMVVATGETTLLDTTVAVDLTEHPTRPGAASGRDGLVRALLALRATFPGVTLVLDDVRPAGEDQVLVRIHTEGAMSGTFLGRPVPASAGQWGPLEVWRIADGQLVERWGGIDPAVLLPAGEVAIPVEALGPGRRRVTVTRLTVEPGATFPIANGQAIRVFAVDAGTLTVDVAARRGGTVAVARGSAMPIVSGPATSIAAVAGDRVVTSPETDYKLTNAGPTPVIALVVIVSNILDGEWPQNSSAAAASWTVAAMPQGLGGALPSPAGFSARVLAADVEVEFPAQPILALGWVCLASGATFALPAGNGPLIAMVDEGSAVLSATGGAAAAILASGEWTVEPFWIESRWQANTSGPAVVLMLSVDQQENAAVIEAVNQEAGPPGGNAAAG